MLFVGDLPVVQEFGPDQTKRITMQEESAENIKSDILPYDFVRENQVIASETKDGYNYVVGYFS